MAEIHVKNTPHNRDKYPEQEKAEKIGARMWEKIKDDIGPGRTFESEGDKRDYLRRVKSNPANVPGIPPFLPSENGPVFPQLNVVSELCNNCGTWNQWLVSNHATYSAKACYCGHLVEWKRQDNSQGRELQ